MLLELLSSFLFPIGNEMKDCMR